MRKAKNGDVTAYGVHAYRSVAGDDSDDKSGTVPFNIDNPDSSSDTAKPSDQTSDNAPGGEKTMYVSYTLRKHEGEWYIVLVDSSTDKLVPDQDSDN